MILTQCKDTNDIENTQIYFHEIYENTQIYIEKSFENTQIWMFEFYHNNNHYVIDTSLYNKKMGFGLTTHPINPHIYEKLYAI